MAQGVLDGVGNTPLVSLRRVVPASGARLAVKLEAANPTGSMKDRMAVEVIRAASADGRLGPGGTVVEYTAGTTGISLAFVALLWDTDYTPCSLMPSAPRSYKPCDRSGRK